MPNIFDLFAQSERALDRSQGGLGIGLSLVKHLIEMHHGTIKVHSEGIGRGATFTLHLPRIEAPESRMIETSGPHEKPRRILVVDDNIDAADSLAMLLRLEGHEVETAYSAHGALEATERLKPDVVVLDIGLPQLDGYEVARQLRANPTLSGMQLIALTGYGQNEDRARSIAAGFDAHFTKPVQREALAELFADKKRSDPPAPTP